jgi:hypothetical protein
MPPVDHLTHVRQAENNEPAKNQSTGENANPYHAVYEALSSPAPEARPFSPGFKGNEPQVLEIGWPFAQEKPRESLGKHYDTRILDSEYHRPFFYWSTTGGMGGDVNRALGLDGHASWEQAAAKLSEMIKDPTKERQTLDVIQKILRGTIPPEITTPLLGYISEQLGESGRHLELYKDPAYHDRYITGVRIVDGSHRSELAGYEGTVGGPRWHSK